MDNETVSVGESLCVAELEGETDSERERVLLPIDFLNVVVNVTVCVGVSVCVAER